jgi:nicotinic acid mononucleotide adenylyltransferase
MNTIVYGGAFDPPQLAHENLVGQIHRNFQPDKLIIVPSWPRFDKEYKTTTEHRQRLVHIFVASIQKEFPNTELCEDFLLGKLPSTTLITDAFFQERLGYSPTQVFGTDVVADMSTWDPSWRVERILPKIFVSRRGSSPDMSQLANYGIFHPQFPKDIAALSSTLVRENIKNRVFNGLNQDVEVYVRRYNLYQ